MKLSVLYLNLLDPLKGYGNLNTRSPVFPTLAVPWFCALSTKHPAPECAAVVGTCSAGRGCSLQIFCEKSDFYLK